MYDKLRLNEYLTKKMHLFNYYIKYKLFFFLKKKKISLILYDLKFFFRYPPFCII
jgi:hypothetical protein